MEDKLKRFVEENREEFEVHEPAEHLWDGVNGRLQHGKKDTHWRQLAIAASLLLVVTCGTWLFVATRPGTPVAAPTVEVHSEIMQAEAHFAAIVQMKDAELDKYCKPNPELCKEFEQDLVTLNTEYHRLKSEYTVSADKKVILQAMMANLQMQVQLISRQLQIMESVKKKKEEVEFI